MSSGDYMVWFLLTVALAGLATFGSLTAAYFVGKRERRRPDADDPPRLEETDDAQPEPDRDRSRPAA